MRIMEKVLFPEVTVFSFEETADNRGVKYKAFSERAFSEMNINFKVKEEIIYCIPKKDTLYGIHFQNMPKSQQKIVSLVSGKGVDYVIDLRKGSSTYKKWISVEMSEDNHRQVLVPVGFGHLFRSTTDNVVLMFKIDEEFDPKYSRALSYKDPEIALDIMHRKFIVSDYDEKAPWLQQSDCNFVLTTI